MGFVACHRIERWLTDPLMHLWIGNVLSGLEPPPRLDQGCRPLTCGGMEAMEGVEPSGLGL